MNYLVHLLFPHETNNHKAKVIRPSGLSLILVFLLFIQFGVRSINNIGPQVLGYAANISTEEVIRLTNEKRAQNGLTPVTYNAALSQAAQAKAADMINKDYWAHVAPDGTQPWSFFRNAGYSYKYAGENLARDFSNASSTVDAWMASPTHRDNLLSSKYKEIGIAVIDGDLAGVDTTIVVQLFGTRVGDSIPVQPVANAQHAQQTAKPTVRPTTRATARSQPTPEVTATPTPEAPTAAGINQPSESTLPQENNNRVLISPFNVTKVISGFLVIALLVVLLVDMVIIARRRIARVSSRSFAHFAFFGMIIAILAIAKYGQIL